MEKPEQESHTNRKRELVQHELKSALINQLVKHQAFGVQTIDELAKMIEMEIFIFSDQNITNRMYMTKCWDLATNIRNTENTDFFRKVALLYFHTLQSVKIESVKIKRVNFRSCRKLFLGLLRTL